MIINLLILTIDLKIKKQKVLQIPKRSMMGGAGRNPNVNKTIKEVGNKLLNETTPTIDKQSFAMRPCKVNKGIIDNKGKPIEKIIENHISSVDDQTNLSTFSHTRSPSSPLGQPNELLTPKLMKPNKPLNSSGSGQYAARFKNPLKVDQTHMTNVSDKDIQSYYATNQKLLQDTHDKHLKEFEKENKEILHTVDPNKPTPNIQQASNTGVSIKNKPIEQNNDDQN